MIRINLLPHREMRRERRKKDFVGLGIFSAIGAAGVAFLAVTFVTQLINDQTARNDFIKKENVKLDEQIKEIATLQSDIEALKARQSAVENLQSDRTLPVHLLDELLKRVPEGIQLDAIDQADLKVTIKGKAQSNDRVSEFLRQLAYQTPWLEKPELTLITATTLDDGRNKGKEGKRVFAFTLSVLLKRPTKAVDAAKATTADASAKTPAVAAAKVN
jgi:type IV pilus assembly protein PilN